MTAKKRTLLLVAVGLEAEDIIPSGAQPFWTNPSAPSESPQEAYELDENLILGITGPMGHSMCAVATLLLNRNTAEGQPPFEQVVNFGGAGAYTWGDAAKFVTPDYTPKAWFVGKSRRWDQFIPARGFEYYGEVTDLVVPDGQTALLCQSANRFSSNFDQAHFGFLQGDLEDNELYDLTRWARIQSLPLASIKFVTNLTTPTGALDYFANLPAGRKVGTEMLETFLEEG